MYVFIFFSYNYRKPVYLQNIQIMTNAINIIHYIKYIFFVSAMNHWLSKAFEKFSYANKVSQSV